MRQISLKQRALGTWPCSAGAEVGGAGARGVKPGWHSPWNEEGADPG